MMNVAINPDKNGIEVRFSAKPAPEILTTLKDNGFRWSSKQKMWYARQSAERMDILKGMGEFEPPTIPQEKKPEVYDLWAMTRTDNIENNFVKYHIYDTKEIAKIIRTHIRQRFPMVKWSVTCSFSSCCSEINIRIKSSPWPENSDELKAIAHYAYKFADSYNYDNSDSMSDYYDVNFYGNNEYSIIDKYDYQQREATVSEENISADFQQKKAEFEKAEEERREREYQEYLKQREIEEAEYNKREEQRRKNHEIIEAAAETKDVDYFVLNCATTNTRKEDSIDGYFDDRNGNFKIEIHRENNKVAREVYFSKEVYDLFVNQLMDDYSFLAGMGGSETNDKRIKTMSDYNMMTAEERKTVEWYNHKCVAVFCDGELKLVIDPQGFDYARYVFFVDDESEIKADYHTPYGMTDEAEDEYTRLAETLEDISANIIAENNLRGTWDKEKFPEYKKLIKEWIYSNNFPFNVNVVRAISPELEDLKSAMYKLLTETDGMQEQFKRAGLVEGQKITIIQMNDFGGMATARATFKSFECGKYAQYNDAVKLIVRPENKRKDYYKSLYRDVLIYNGWLDVPKSLFWEERVENGMRITTTKYLSCDKKQYDVVLDYFKQQGIKPIINTYKPQF